MLYLYAIDVTMTSTLRKCAIYAGPSGDYSSRNFAPRFP